MKAGFPGQSRDWCVTGTYLLPVPMEHGEMESRLEPSEGHLSPPRATQGTASGCCPTMATHGGVTTRPPGTGCAHLL